MHRLPWLDWVRFLAAFMVVVSHARGSTWVGWSSLPPSAQTTITKVFYAVTRAGLEWVVIFFVLSGFLVGGNTIRKVRGNKFQTSWFVLDRITRIWVPLLPALIFTTLVAATCGMPLSMVDLAGNVLGLQGIFSQNFGHNEPLWSLSYEIWFYVIVGAVAAFWHSGMRGRTWAAIALMIGILAFLKLSPWLLGCWLVGVFSSLADEAKFHPAGPFPWLILALIGAGWSQLDSGTHAEIFMAGTGIAHGRDFALLLESLGAGLFIAAITRRPPSDPRIASIDFAGGKFAAISYTLYLTHYPTLLLWEKFGPEKSVVLNINSLLLFAGKISSCLMLAFLLYLPFEARTSLVRERLRRFLGMSAAR